MPTHRFGGGAARVVWLEGDAYQTPLELYEYLTGRREIEWNPGMRRGVELEPVARRLDEEQSGMVTRPAFVEHPAYPWAVASVDGLTIERDRGLEVKCPSLDVHESITDLASVPTGDLVQCRWYLHLTGAALWKYVSFHPDASVPLKVVFIPADPVMQTRLWEKCKAWYETHIVGDEPPPRTEKDVVMRDDAPFIEAARIFREEEAIVTEHQAKLDAARELLLSLTNGAMKVEGGGVKVTRYQVSGQLDWSALLKRAKQAGIDTESYRKEGREQVRVTVTAK